MGRGGIAEPVLPGTATLNPGVYFVRVAGSDWVEHLRVAVVR
jgi:hypothetical protein